MLRAHLAEKYANGDARWVFSMPAFLSLGELLKQLPIREKKACFLLEITDPDTLVIELDGLPKGKPIAARCLNRFILARQVVRAEYVVSPTGPTGYFIRIASAKSAAPFSEKPEKKKGLTKHDGKTGKASGASLLDSVGDGISGCRRPQCETNL